MFAFLSRIRPMLAALAVLLLGTTAAVAQSGGPVATLLASGLEGTSGSTVGPDGALYVTEGAAGRISRVDPQTGAVTTFASGLPTAILAASAGRSTSRSSARPRTSWSPSSAPTSAAATWSASTEWTARTASPSSRTSARSPWPIRRRLPFVVPTGVQYALQTYRGGFLVTDGHHNRVLRVTLDGEVTELIAFGDIVPTGLAVWGNTVYMAEAGPVPHLPAERQGRVVRAEVAHRHGGGLRRPAPRRRGIRPRSHAVRPLAGRLGRRPSRVLRRCRTPARSSRSTGTAPSPSSWTVWTGRPRSSSSGTPRTSSPSPGRSGRSTACRVDDPGA